MRIAYLDCFSGISGDMFLGALVDAGVSAKLLEDTVAGARYRRTAGDIAGDAGRNFGDQSRRVRQRRKRSAAGSFLGAEQTCTTHRLDGTTSPPNITPTRSRAERDSRRSSRKRPSAARESNRDSHLRGAGRGRSRDSRTSIERVHFHEVGAVDALVDIVCAAVGAESLAVEEWVCSPLNVGGGTVKCAHGTLPVPAPATLKLLRDAPVYSSGPQVELVTPTGAAIVKTLSGRFAPFPAMKVEKAGYGAGTRDFPEHPNLLRLTIGEAAPAECARVHRSQ